MEKPISKAEYLDGMVEFRKANESRLATEKQQKCLNDFAIGSLEYNVFIIKKWIQFFGIVSIITLITLYCSIMYLSTIFNF